MDFIMPPVVQRPTPNYTPSRIRHDLVVCHRTEGGYAGAVAWLCDPRSRASSHLVMKADGSEATQLVPLQYKAWAQCAFNLAGVSLEIEGYTAQGLAGATATAAARIVAWLCRAFAIPPVWAEGGQGRGVCQHHDLGAAGGGHVDFCGVGGEAWLGFMGLVKDAYDAIGQGPLPPFALYGLPNPHQAGTTPDAAPEPSHGGADRREPGDAAAHPTLSGFPDGSMADLQWRLNRAGAQPPIRVDGWCGPQTRAALERFQAAHACASVDGKPGPETWAALQRATAA
jgi:N-acetyl-anhydromuramyl-L-alanine amidase AmpD